MACAPIGIIPYQIANDIETNRYLILKDRATGIRKRISVSNGVLTVDNAPAPPIPPSGCPSSPPASVITPNDIEVTDSKYGFMLSERVSPFTAYRIVITGTAITLETI